MLKGVVFLDAVAGVVLILAAILAPWMLGVTTRETIWVLNGLGFLSGALWIVKRVVRLLASADRQSSVRQAGARWPMACFGVW